MRQVHLAGEKLFVEYSGNKPRVVDPTTGEVTEAELFVAVLGASNLTYVEATRTQTIADWIGSHRGERIASHARSARRGQHTTTTTHMQKSHQAQAEWSPTRSLAWAATVGPETARLAGAILASRPHPEQGYRSCLGILRLFKKYGAERLEVACGRAMAVGARSYHHVESMLKLGLDRLAPDGADGASRPTHENIRGRGYYH